MVHEIAGPIEEQLAKKFYHMVPRHSRFDHRNWDSLGHEERQPWINMGLEALRCMRWCREDGYNDGLSDGNADEPGRTNSAITLPPAGWTP